MGEPPIRPHVRLAGGIPVHFAAIRSCKIQRGRQLGDRPHCGSALGEHRVGLGDRDFELVLHLGARLTGFDAKHFDLAANLGERRQMLSWLFGLGTPRAYKREHYWFLGSPTPWQSCER